MATQKIYETPGAATTFRGDAAGDVTFTPQNEAAGKGRISDPWDRGAGSQPARYKWRLRTRWAATATAGNSVRVYLVTSDGTNADGTLSATDAELTSELPLVNNCQFIGAVVSPAVDQVEVSSGVCIIHDRYVQVAVWNGSATKALTDTETDHILTLTPIPDDIQAAS
jgi:hypothetical protein